MQPDITDVAAQPDLEVVTVTYVDVNSKEVDPYGNPCSYTTTVPYVEAPNQDDLTSDDNTDYYVAKLMGE